MHSKYGNACHTAAEYLCSAVRIYYHILCANAPAMPAAMRMTDVSLLMLLLLPVITSIGISTSVCTHMPALLRTTQQYNTLLLASSNLLIRLCASDAHGAQLLMQHQMLAEDLC